MTPSLELFDGKLKEKYHPKDEEIHIQQSPRTMNGFCGDWLYNLRLGVQNICIQPLATAPVFFYETAPV